VVIEKFNPGRHLRHPLLGAISKRAEIRLTTSRLTATSTNEATFEAANCGVFPNGRQSSGGHWGCKWKGRAIVERFAASGARVHIIDLTQAESVAREIGNGADVQVQQCDVSDKAQVQTPLTTFSGPKHVNIL